MYIPKRPYELRGKGFQGDALFVAPNPPFGAVFTYYLKESIQTMAEMRRDNERELNKKGKTIPFPGWDKLRKEEREEKPVIILTVKDEEGQVVRRLKGPSSKGMHRVAWDLRYPPVEPVRQEIQEGYNPWLKPPQGPFVIPGAFTISIAKLVNGEMIPFGKTYSLQVESLELGTLAEKDKEKLLFFQKKVGELQRAVMGVIEIINLEIRNITFAKEALMKTPAADPHLFGLLLAIREKLGDFSMKINGDWIIGRRSEPAPPSLLKRINAQLFSTCPITETNKRNYEIAVHDFEELLQDLRQVIEVDLKSFKDKMEELGAPWTPGRSLPRWKKKD